MFEKKITSIVSCKLTNKNKFHEKWCAKEKDLIKKWDIKWILQFYESKVNFDVRNSIMGSCLVELEKDILSAGYFQTFIKYFDFNLTLK